ncbi:MAG: MFS transporter [Methanomassiliicoccales archaeon]|nr:MAG: MFS transporter [Methanomassiliicoccales archaeon]
MDVGYYRGRKGISVALLLLCCTLMGYISRSTISVALPFISDDYGWTSSEQGYWGGILLGIFLVGYGVSNTLLSPLIDVYGPRKCLTAAIAIWSFITFLTGVLGLIFSAFMVLRLLLGVSQGVLFPSASKVTKTGFEPKLRSRVNGLYMSAMFMSNILIALLMLPLIRLIDWRPALCVVAMVGFALAIIVWRHLSDGTGLNHRPKGVREAYGDIIVSLRRVIKVKGFMTVTFADASMNLAFWGLSLWMPTYLLNGKGFSLDDLVWALPLAYTGGVLGILIGSWLSDRIGRRSEVTAAFTLGGALSLLLMMFASGQAEIVACCFAVFFCISLLPANAYTLLQLIVPAKDTGAATGLLNGLSNGLGVFGPVVIGLSVALTENFDSGIAVMAVSQVAAACCIFAFRAYERSAKDDQ